jgi:DNA-binding LacI/PurR family transcriptional regulator
MRTTLKDIARQAGVSTTLVSYIINDRPVSIPEETRARVLKAIETLEYVPSAAAQGLRNQKSRMIAQLFLHYEPETTLSEPCTAGKTPALVDSLALKGYFHLNYPVPEGEKARHDLVNFLRSHRVDGVVIENTYDEDPYIDLVADTHVPFVVYNQADCGHPGSAVVNMDDAGGMRLTVEHLIRKGHTKIGHLQGNLRTYCDAMRRKAYEEVLREHGLAVREDWIRGDGSCTVEDGFRSTGELLDLDDRPTAIAATSDLLAMGALRQIQSRGLRVPEDVALIGFDDIQAASFLSPPLSTVALSYRRIGELAGEQILKLIEEPSLRFDPITVPVRLIERASTAKDFR